MKEPVIICLIMVFTLIAPCAVLAGQINVIAIDMTPTTPLSKPTPSLYQPRYISGFGSGDSFTLFFEDRSFSYPYPISFISTTTGPTGFPDSATLTDVKDTHFCVKDWPITINGTKYAYRAWGAMENTPNHNFYVSKNLKKWKLISTFTIPKLPSVPGGTVYYGFHDVIQLNGTYYAWGECNIGHTLVCRSINGDDEWEAFDRVGGLYSGPLQVSASGTPTGCFFELGGNRGYGKIMVPGDDSAFYLAVNTAAKPSLSPAELEAAFINPDNWTWNDGSTGLPNPDIAILKKTDEHDCRECWLVPNGSAEWTIIYDADFGSDDGDKALGYAIMSALPPFIEIVIDIKPSTYPNSINLGSHGLVPVAILSSDQFEAIMVDPETVEFAGAGVQMQEDSNKWMGHEEDVNGDELIDLVLQFATQDIDPGTFQNGYAVLTGITYDGVFVEGADEVTIVPPE